jgi:hypothetical protein
MSVSVGNGSGDSYGTLSCATRPMRRCFRPDEPVPARLYLQKGAKLSDIALQ